MRSFFSCGLCRPFYARSRDLTYSYKVSCEGSTKQSSDMIASWLSSRGTGPFRFMPTVGVLTLRVVCEDANGMASIGVSSSQTAFGALLIDTSLPGGTIHLPPSLPCVRCTRDYFSLSHRLASHSHSPSLFSPLLICQLISLPNADPGAHRAG